MGFMDGRFGADTPRVTVVVTACSIDRGLVETLAVLREQADKEGAEILLAFNVARDAIAASERETVADFTDRIVFEPRPGKSAALNTAVAESRADVIAFTDDDAKPRAGWLRSLTEPLEKDLALDGVGGRVVPVFLDAPPPRWYRRLIRRKQSHFLGPKHDLGDEALEYGLPTGNSVSPVPLGANCAWRRAALEQFPFREELGPNRRTGMRGGEDTCLALEVLEAGGRILYRPDAIVEHPVTPERMTREYVVEGFRIQGQEFGIIMSILGRVVRNPARFRQGAHRADDAWWLRAVLGPHRTFKRRLGREFARAACASLSLD